MDKHYRKVKYEDNKVIKCVADGIDIIDLKITKDEYDSYCEYIKAVQYNITDIKELQKKLYVKDIIKMMISPLGVFKKPYHYLEYSDKSKTYIIKKTWCRRLIDIEYRSYLITYPSMYGMFLSESLFNKIYKPNNQE